MALIGKLKNLNTQLQETIYKWRSSGAGERVSPDCQDENFANHLKVYEFAAQFVNGKAILDVGSGTGYGTALLVEKGADSAVGIDYAAEAIAFSSERYTQPNLSFYQMDAQEIELPDASFDFALSTENLEHLPRPEDNLAEIRRLLRPGGLAMVATPNKEISSPGLEKPTNRYHLKEFTYEELRSMLLVHFGTVRIIESSLTSASAIGKAMKEERLRRGDVGLDGSVGGTIVIDGLKVDLTHLHNTHSFVALAW